MAITRRTLRPQSSLHIITATPTDAVSGPVKRPGRDICGLSGDLMEMVSKATDAIRMDLWMKEHKKTFSEVLTEYDELVGPDDINVENSIYEEEIFQWREQEGLELYEDFCLDYEGEEWMDGRIIRNGWSVKSYGGGLAKKAMEDFIWLLRSPYNREKMPTPKWLEKVRENKMAKYKGGGCATHTDERREQIHQQLNNWLIAA